jgi:hypothetical protein
MSPISFFNRHPRADFSAYLDGELTSAADKRIESHVAACRTCAAELDSLRVIRTALRAMPETPAPRSFALTPEMAREARPARLAPTPRPMQPLVNGLRMASGGLAAALAVVIVIAVAGGGSGTGSDDSGLSAARLESTTDQYAAAPTESLVQDAGGENAATSAPQGTSSPLFTPFPNIGGTPAAGDGGGSGTGGVGSGSGGSGGGTGGGVGGVGGGGDDSGGTEVPPPGTVPPDAVTTPAPSPEDIVSGQDLDGNSSATEPAKAANDDVSTAGAEDEVPAGDSASDNGGGASALTIVAVVLGVLLGASVIGSIAASRLSRKTP